MGKFDKELVDYAKASGAFEYAAKRCIDAGHDPQWKTTATILYSRLENMAYPPIEDIYRNNSGDNDAIHAYEIACRDLILMRDKLQSL